MTYIPSGTELLNPFEILKRAGIGEGMKIADLGCGTMGHFVFAASHLVGDRGAVYAIDILKSALAGIESRIKMEGVSNVQTIWSDIEVLGGTKVGNNEVDIAFLHNVGAKADMIREAARLIKPGGKLLIVDWEKTSAPFGPPTKNRPDPERIKKDAEEIGLKFLEEFKAGPYHFGIIFVK
jgi:ubiquinone/menaquinone biosynthesis C-methylase UbiE